MGSMQPSMESLFAAKGFVARAGEIEMARQSLAALAQLAARREHDDRHPGKAKRYANEVPLLGTDAINKPEPGKGNGHIDAAIRRIHSPSGGRMQRQQPREDCQAERGGDQQPGRAPLSKPEIGQVAADDFRNGRQHEQGRSNNHTHIVDASILGSGFGVRPGVF